MTLNVKLRLFPLFSCILTIFVVVGSPSISNSQIIDSLFEEQWVLIFDEQYTGCKDCEELTKVEKGHKVYQELLQLQEATQMEVWEFLDQQEWTYRPYFIANVIEIREKLTAEDVEAILDLFGERLQISANLFFSIDLPDEVNNLPAPNRSSDAEWNISRIGTPEVWEMGIRGEGVVIGGQDTGYEWNHPDLIENYRGWDGQGVNHNYHWYDAIDAISPLHGDSIPDPQLNPCGLQIKEPCDDHRHGTHTMGTMVGGDAGGTSIGVAPSAKWIGCRNMERGYGSLLTYLRCFQWFLAPLDTNGHQPRPDLAPHVINNSWTCPEMEGCNFENFHIIGNAIDNLRDAGIVVVASAGNSGNQCGKISSPPSVFPGGIVVGSTNQNDTISSFSSFGPVTALRDTFIKPDVTAPGSNIRSATLNGGYRNMNGTSMAGPHVAGTVALIIAANPTLEGKVEAIENIIKEAAIPTNFDMNCGSYKGTDHPNFAYGFGRLDAYKAVTLAMETVNSNQHPGGFNSKNKIKVYPVPTSSVLYIKTEEQLINGQFQLFSLGGHLLDSGELPSKIQTDHLQSGMYLIRFFNDKINEVHRVVVE